MKLHKSSYGILIFAVLTFSNPHFNVFDFFPDFIGAFIIAALLRRASDIVPFFKEAEDGFTKVGILGLVRIPAALIMYQNILSGMDIVPLFTLIFCVIELLLLLPAVVNLARGLSYLGERVDGTALLKPFRMLGFTVEIDSLRNFALFFVCVRAAFNFIPQLCHLTLSNDMAMYYARMIYTPLEIGMLIAVAVLGLAFAVCVISYTVRVKRCGGVADGIAAIAGEEKLAEIKVKTGAKAHVRALLVLAVAMLFNIDIALDTSGGFNIMPRFIFAVLLLISIWGFMTQAATKIGAMILTLIYTVTSLFTMSLTTRFNEEFAVDDLVTNMFAQGSYDKIESAALVEMLSFLALVGFATAVLIMAVRRHTGLSPNEEEYSRVAKQRHRELSLRVIGFSVLLTVTGVMKYVNILLIGSPVKFDVQDMPTELGGGNSGPIYAARLPWFGTVSTIVCILLVLYTFYLVGILRDEVRMKYNLPRKGDD